MKTCILKIIDEVNVKILGLESSDSKALVNKFSYLLPHARHTPAFKLGRWNGKISFFQLGGGTYINLLDEIVPYLVEHGYDIEISDNRSYKTHFDFTEVDENYLAHKKWPEGHRLAGQSIILNDHQVLAINNYLKNPQSLQELSTASGKTIIVAALSIQVEEYGRSIIIVPNRSLIKQTLEDYVNLGLDVGVFYGKEKDYTKTHTICTWQSLNSLFKKTKAGEAEITFADFIEDVVCVIVDECHGVKADALKTMLTGVMAHIPLRWGLTGTIPKEDFNFKALQVSIGDVVGQVTAAELQQKGILADCFIHIKQLQDNRDLGDYQSELKWLLSNGDRLDQVAEMIERYAATGNTLVLVDRIACIQDLALRLPPERVAVVTGKVKDKDREAEYANIATSDNKILIATYGVAAVGINLPSLRNIILIEPGKSFIRVIQSIGRGLRIDNDKDYVDIYDITSNCKFSKRHLTTRKKFYKDAEYAFKVEKIKWQ